MMMHPQLALPLSLPAEPSLANFIVGSNDEAMAQVYDVAHGVFKHSALFLWGGSGVGKTHVLSSLAMRPDARWVTASNVHDAPFDDSPSLYLIDDVDLFNAAQQKSTFHLYNHVRARRGDVLVMSASQPPSRLLLEFLPDLRTRLAWDLVYELHALTDDDKSQVLKQRIHELGLTVSADVVPYMLRHLSRDLSILNEFLQHLDTYSLEAKARDYAAFA